MALVATLVAAALSVLGPAAAAANPGDAVSLAANGLAAGDISTVAGGVGGPANGTTVPVAPCNVAFAGGHLYIADSQQRSAGSFSGAVREMSPGSALLTTPVGTHAAGPLGDGGPATAASVDSCGATADSAGNLVISDSRNNRVRVVAASTGTFYGQAMTGGDIYTVAGTGQLGFSGDGGPATSAELSYPDGVRVDHNGNLVIADADNNRVRVVAETAGTFYGQAMTAGDIYTVAGDGTRGFSGDFGPATSAELSGPTGLQVDAAGNLLIADSANCRIRVVAESTGTMYGQAMTAGDIYTVAGDGICRFSGDGAPATSAGVNPEGVAVDGAGNLVLADYGDNRIRVVAEASGTFYGQAMTAGDIYTVAGNGTKGFSGDGGPATSAELNGPFGVTVNAGNVMIADYLNNRVRMVAARTGTFFGITMTAGDIYTIAGNGRPYGFSGDGGPATSAELSVIEGIAVDPTGNLLIADTGNQRIRVAAATSGTFYGVPMTAGNIYTIAGNGRRGISSDGTLDTKTKLNGAAQVTVDPAGNLVITDNSRIRVIAARAGTFYGQAMKADRIYTIAGNGATTFSGDFGPATSAGMSPEGVAFDPAGNLVIADTNNSRIRVVAKNTGTFYGITMTAGDIYTVAGYGPAGYSGDGGPATHAELNNPAAVTVDPAGNLVISDQLNQRIRVAATSTGTFYGQAMTAGDIYTIAGNGTAGYSGDGGPATSAELTDPVEVVVDHNGNLVIADVGNTRVRVVAETTGTFYGQAMTAGDIYTVAGNGGHGFSGDGGPATSATIFPTGVAVDGAGNLMIADGRNDRVREVAA